MHNNRSLHLIDLENLCADGLPGERLIEKVWQTYRYGVPNSPEDHYIVGSSHIFAARAWFVLPAQGIQRRVRSGKDGGELAILADIDLDHVARRFTRLVIASGDGIFAGTAAAARGSGLHVHQVTGLGACSRALASAAHSHSRLRLAPDVAALQPAVAMHDHLLAA